MTKKKTIFSVTMALGVAILGFLLCSGAHVMRVIVQSTDVAIAAGLVRSVGGSITHELEIINAVGAEVSPRQLDDLRKLEGVRIYENQRVAVTKVTALRIMNVLLNGKRYINACMGGAEAHPSGTCEQVYSDHARSLLSTVRSP